MTYRPLDEASCADLVRARPSLAEVVGGNQAELDVHEIGDGNLNLVFVVRSVADPARSLVLKQALPYLRVAGESWPLTRDRMRIETEALLRYGELAPEFVPRVYDHDVELSFVAMEDLADHTIMRRALIEGRPLPNVAEHLGTFMGRLHASTSTAGMDGPDRRADGARFLNPALCQLQEDFVFTNPYMDSSENVWIGPLDDLVAAVRADAELKLAIAEMKDSYLSHGQALLHGDLHTGSVMVTEHDTRVIDPEFGFYGPIGYDVGTLFANFAIAFHAAETHADDPADGAARRAAISAMFGDCWTAYVNEFERVWVDRREPGRPMRAGYWQFTGGDAAFGVYRRRYLRRVLVDSAGHGACEILRRLMGIVSVPDLSSIKDVDVRAGVERTLLTVARRWLLERETMASTEDLVALMQAAA